MARQQNGGEPMGGKVVLSVVDGFDAEVVALRASRTFQSFLNVRSLPTRTRPFRDYLRELDDELKRGRLADERTAT